MEKQKTALQELNDRIDELFSKDGCLVYLKVEAALKELLLKEKEQIEEAWNDANGHSFYEYGSDYYTNTYTDETK